MREPSLSAAGAGRVEEGYQSGPLSPIRVWLQSRSR